MTSWLEAVPTLLVALAILAIPGGIVVAVLRLRGLLAAALAPAISISIIGVSAIVAPWLGLRWGWWVPAIGTAVVVVALLVACRFIPPLHFNRMSRAQSREPKVLAWALIGVAGAAIAITTRVVIAAHSLEQITQNYDTVFHLNAVRHVLDTGNGSSFYLSTFMRSTPDLSFYPGAWHDLVSLTIHLSGASIPAATNVMWIATSAVLWPLSCVLFTRVLVGPRASIIAMAGLLSAAFAAFPYILLYYGSAYPNSLADCLVPIGLALAVWTVRGGRDQGRLAPRSLAITLFVLLLPGIALAQPNGVFTIAFVLTPMLVAVLWRWFRRGFRSCLESGLLRIGVFLLSVILVGTLLATNSVFMGLFRFSSPQSMSFSQSLGRALTNAPLPTSTPAWFLSALVLAGLIGAVVQFRQWWMVPSFILTLLVYGFATGANDRLMNALIAPWWGNPERIAALMPLLGVPLAAIGVIALASMLFRRLRGLRRRAWVAASAAATVIVILVVSPTLRQMDVAVAGVYAVPAHPDPLAQLDTDEMALLAHLDDYVPSGAVIANNPWNGSALAMALSNRTVLFPYSSIVTFDNDQWWLSVGLANIAQSEIVCDAAKRKNVRYLLDFGTQFIEAEKYGQRRYAGIDAAGESGAFELVAAVGHAKLFKLVDCASW